MRLFIGLCFSLLLLVACNNSKETVRKGNFQSFDFTYNDVFSTCFSIKFQQSDTAYIRQHFSFSDNPKSETSYYAVLSKGDRLTLDSFINTLPFVNYDTSYYEDYQDGIDYQLYILKDNIDKSIRVHSHSAPSALDDLKNWIVEKKTKLQLHQIDTIIHFRSDMYVLPLQNNPLHQLVLNYQRRKVTVNICFRQYKICLEQNNAS